MDFDAEDHNDVWPGFVDVMTSLSMFLLLAFVSVVPSYDQDLADRDRAKRIGAPIVEVLNGIRFEEFGTRLVPCRLERWDVMCTFLDSIKFRSGEWAPPPDDRDKAEKKLRTIAACLRQLASRGVVRRISVEGHTDEDGYHPQSTVGRLSMTNWELSSARAGYVVRVLQSFVDQDENKSPWINPSLLEAIGFAEHSKRKDPPSDDKEWQRFVEIRVHLNDTELPADSVSCAGLQ